MKLVPLINIALLGFLVFSPPGWSQSDDEYFKFHLIGEPHTLDPAMIRGVSGNYLFHNLFRSLYRYTKQNGLEPESARECKWSHSKKLTCTLRQDLNWSDGQAITARDFVYAFKRLVSPNTKTVQTELLTSLKSAKAILSGAASPKELGIVAKGNYQLIFLFDKPDPEFLYKLINPALAPVRPGSFPTRQNAAKLVTNGPYKISRWKVGHYLILEPNPHYFQKGHRPLVKILFIEDDSTALTLFQSGHLNLLRRVLTADIPQLRNHPGFLQVPIAKFDYIGFGPALKPYPHLRKALTYSLNYKQLQVLYDALGTPGCPSLPSSYMDKPVCYEFDLKKAKSHFKKVPTEAKQKKWSIYFSQMGGDDIKKGMEWLQHQWKKHLGLNIELQSREQGVYLQELASNTPAIFRKGVGLDRPTCLAGLEVFAPDHSENFIKFKNSRFTEILTRLKPGLSPSKQKSTCRKAVSLLIMDQVLIPLGEIHYTMLHDQKFKGWQINELNQLDLTHLE